MERLPEPARWALYYIKLTWFAGTIAFNVLTLSMYDGLKPLELPSRSIWPVLYGLSAVLAAVSILLTRKFLTSNKINTVFSEPGADWISKVRKLVPRYAIVWGLNDGVFLYGVMCSKLTGQLWLGFPLVAASLFLNLITFPNLDEACANAIELERNQAEKSTSNDHSKAA